MGKAPLGKAPFHIFSALLMLLVVAGSVQAAHAQELAPPAPDLRLPGMEETGAGTSGIGASGSTYAAGNASGAGNTAALRDGRNIRPGQRDAAMAAPLPRPAPLPRIADDARLPEVPRLPAGDTRRATPLMTGSTGRAAASAPAAMDARIPRTGATAGADEAGEGLRMGAFRLRGTLEMGGSVRYQRNAADTVRAGLRIAPDLRLESMWPRHALAFTASGSFIAYTPQGVDAQGALGATLRLDARRDTRLELSLNHAVDEADDGSGTSGLSELQHELSANVALEHERYRLRGTLSAGVLWHEEKGRARDYLQPQASARLRLRTAPVLAIYGEVGVDARRYRENAAANDSIGGYVEGGVELLRGPIWEGQVGVRLAARDYRDPAQETFIGAGVNGNLTWRPTRRTDITLAATFDLQDTASGRSRQQTLNLSVRQQIRSTLQGDVALGVEHDDVSGGQDNLTLRASASLSWQIWQRLWIVSRYAVERTHAGSLSQPIGAPEHRFDLALRRQF